MDAMKRRGFLGRFAATVAGLSILPVKAKAEPKVEKQAPTLITLEWAVLAFAREFRRALNQTTTLGQNRKLTRKIKTLHISVEDITIMAPNEALELYIRPAAEAMAMRFKADGMSRMHNFFGATGGQQATLKSEQWGMCVRAVKNYSIYTDHITYDFQVYAS